MAESKDLISSLIEMQSLPREERLRRMALSITSLHQEAQDELAKTGLRLVVIGLLAPASIGWTLGAITAVERGADIKVGIAGVAMGILGVCVADRVYNSARATFYTFQRAKSDATALTTALAAHVIAEPEI